MEPIGEKKQRLSKTKKYFNYSKLLTGSLYLNKIEWPSFRINIVTNCYNYRSYSILSGLTMYLHPKKKGNVFIVFKLFCRSLLLLLRWDTGKVRDRFGGMGRFNGWLRCKGWVNIVIINVITEMNYRCNYIQVFLIYKYNVKTCMYTISALYQMINLNVSTYSFKGLFTQNWKLFHVLLTLKAS